MRDPMNGGKNMRVGQMRRNLARLWVALLVTIGLAVPGLSLATAPEATAAASTVSIWGGAKPAGVKLLKNTRAVELGTRFTATMAGKATGVRFYKLKGMKGKHVGTLWSSSGKKLARVTFTKESASGWQSAKFSKAVALKARTAYVVSYHVVKGGKYARTTKYAGGSTTSALKLPATKTAVYRHKTTSAFPKTAAPSSAVYWVDVTVAPQSATASVAKPVPEAKAFPTSSTTGVPAGWSPKKSVQGDYNIDTAGAVVEDLRVTDGDIRVNAPNVTLRRVELISGRIINDPGRDCYNGLLVEDTSILRGAHDPENPAIEAGGYTLRRVKIDGPSEGIRIGEKPSGCGSVLVEDSWMKIDPPDNCPNDDYWHGDGLQGYQGPAVTVRNSAIHLAQVKGCLGTSAFFYPDQGNTSATVENVLVSGGGYVFRMYTPGSVSGLKVIDDSWKWNAVDVDCSQVTWGSGNEIVTVNSDGTLKTVSSLKCALH